MRTQTPPTAATTSRTRVGPNRIRLKIDAFGCGGVSGLMFRRTPRRVRPDSCVRFPVEEQNSYTRIRALHVFKGEGGAPRCALLTRRLFRGRTVTNLHRPRRIGASVNDRVAGRALTRTDTRTTRRTSKNDFPPDGKRSRRTARENGGGSHQRHWAWKWKTKKTDRSGLFTILLCGNVSSACVRTEIKKKQQNTNGNGAHGRTDAHAHVVMVLPRMYRDDHQPRSEWGDSAAAAEHPGTTRAPPRPLLLVVVRHLHPPPPLLLLFLGRRRRKNGTSRRRRRRWLTAP